MYVQVQYVNFTSSQKTQFCFFKRNILPYNTCAPQNIGQLTFLAFKMLLLYTYLLQYTKTFVFKQENHHHLSVALLLPNEGDETRQIFGRN